MHETNQKEAKCTPTIKFKKHSFILLLSFFPLLLFFISFEIGPNGAQAVLTIAEDDLELPFEVASTSGIMSCSVVLGIKPRASCI